MKNETIGIIGCGNIADTHVEAIKVAVPEADICVCDPIPGKAELLRKKYDLKSSYISIHEMLSKEKPFSVHILSPPQLHVEHSIQCLKAGCNVLVEKPLAFRTNDVKKIYAASKKYNKKLCVDHSILYQPSVLKVFSKLKNDPNEKILYVNCFYGIDVDQKQFALTPKGHWKNALPGGPIIDTIIHPVTLSVQMTGKPVEMKVNFSGPTDNPIEVFIFWQGEKAIASITVSFQAQPFRRVTEITTNKNTFVIDHSTETQISLNAGFGPKVLRKLLRNFGYGVQLILGTIGTVIQVLGGKLKGNPGARGLVKAYYKHILGEGEIPVSEENVWNSTYALENITKELDCPSIKRPFDVKINHKNSDRKSNDENSVKTLVTGASGFLGSKLCELLTENGRHVIAQVRRGPNADKLYSPRIFKVFEDFNLEPVNYEHLLNGVKEVVHCAHANGAKTWDDVKRTNVEATIRLFDVAAEKGCEKFILLSSVAVYGVHQRESKLINEQMPVTFGSSKWDFYIRSKSLAEKMLLEKSKNRGLRLLILRPGILYSADGTKLARRSVPLKKGRTVITFGNGKNYLPFTRVDAVAETICHVLELDPFPEGIYNLTGSPQEISKEFISNRMKKLGVTCHFLMLPAFPFRVVAASMEFFHNITFRKSSPKITRYIIDSSTRNFHYDCSNAERDLGWNSARAVRS